MHAHNHLSTFIIAHLSMITQMFGMVYYPIVISDLLTPSGHAHNILPSLAVKSLKNGLFQCWAYSTCSLCMIRVLHKLKSLDQNVYVYYPNFGI